MTGLKKDSWFTVVVLVLIALILGEIGFLGYQFWFRSDKSQKEPLIVVPSSPPYPSPSSVTTRSFVQLVFGWLEELSAESVILTTEDDQKAIFSLDKVEVFLFRPEEAKEPISLFTLFDENFEKKPGVERIEIDQVELGSPAYLVLELTADDLYLGRRLVIIKE